MKILSVSLAVWARALRKLDKSYYFFISNSTMSVSTSKPAPTLKDEAIAFLNKEPGYSVPADDSRTWIHDILHSRLGLNGTARNELIVGIFQAVLLRTTNVSSHHGPLKDGGTNLTLQDIKDKVIPAIRDFNQELAEKHGWDIASDISEEEIVSTFHRANVLRRLILRKYGCNFGEMPVQNITGLKTTDVSALFNASEVAILASDLV